MRAFRNLAHASHQFPHTTNTDAFGKGAQAGISSGCVVCSDEPTRVTHTHTTEMRPRQDSRPGCSGRTSTKRSCYSLQMRFFAPNGWRCRNCIRVERERTELLHFGVMFSRTDAAAAERICEEIASSCIKGKKKEMRGNVHLLQRNSRNAFSYHRNECHKVVSVTPALDPTIPQSARMLSLWSRPPTACAYQTPPRALSDAVVVRTFVVDMPWSYGCIRSQKRYEANHAKPCDLAHRRLGPWHVLSL